MHYVNPKKGKRAVKEEPEITPLSTTYSRKDLERLAEEKKALADAEAETEEIDIKEELFENNEITDAPETEVKTSTTEGIADSNDADKID